ncbi:hypothetical protein FW755_11560 [Lonepinella koalarum]|uniref:hypothetical protein n=1 Tax=Lonepinella koalarum TaxID=53417 RepID=UPI0011E439C4|nr:hypothetical protein [Lonepinella koalarum]TYG33553.1 hypothetical protein FW755_11560 [Lonepinella koalarum]
MNEIKISLSAYDFNEMLNYAVRYCLERHSYAVWDGQQYIKKYWQLLDNKTKTIIAQDIQRHLDMYEDLQLDYYFKLDYESWANTLNWIQQQPTTPTKTKKSLELPVISQEKCNAKKF